MKVLDSGQMRALEQAAVDQGGSYLELMENAGSAAARFLIKMESPAGKRIVILCGKGNNGGDGYVVARHLTVRGARVAVVLAQGDPATEISREMFEKLSDTSVRVLYLDRDWDFIKDLISSADYLYDGIYGIGFRGAVPEELARLFDAAEASPAHKIALDLPSGVQCDTGAVEGRCIHADDTVTFSARKPAHLLRPAMDFCGEVTCVDVGIPDSLLEASDAAMEVTSRETAAPLFTPREQDSNKGTYGTLLCVCGSEGMAGAAILSAGAALRCGAGLVNLALPGKIYPIVAPCLPECVYTLWEEKENGVLTYASQQKLDAVLKKASACVIGCGLGQSLTALRLTCDLIEYSKVPVVVDADGINAVARNIDVLKAAQAPVILTPHPGEMARLLETTVAEVQANRLTYAKLFAEQYGVIVVLKGTGTITAAPDGRTFWNPTGNPGMAKGGSGDVLAGMIGSFLAQGADPVVAAAAGAYLHGLAGDECARKLSQRGMLPSDMIDALPVLFSKFEQ